MPAGAAVQAVQVALAAVADRESRVREAPVQAFQAVPAATALLAETVAPEAKVVVAASRAAETRVLTAMAAQVVLAAALVMPEMVGPASMAPASTVTGPTVVWAVTEVQLALALLAVWRASVVSEVLEERRAATGRPRAAATVDAAAMATAGPIPVVGCLVVMAAQVGPRVRSVRVATVATAAAAIAAAAGGTAYQVKKVIPAATPSLVRPVVTVVTAVPVETGVPRPVTVVTVVKAERVAPEVLAVPAVKAAPQAPLAVQGQVVVRARAAATAEPEA